MPKPITPSLDPWTGLDLMSDTPTEFLQSVTPAASLSTLSSLVDYVHHALTGPYAVTALTCDFSNGSGGSWFWAQRINPGAGYMRGRFHVALTLSPGSGPPADISTYSTSSGSAAADEITVGVDQEGTVGYPPGETFEEILSSEDYDASPAAAVDRPYELFVLDTAGGTPTATLPYTEGFEGSGMLGASGVIEITTL